MRYVQHCLFTIAFFGALIPVNGFASTRCGGGDSGPKPLADISHTFDAQVAGIPTEGSVEQFLFSEKDNAIIYRNEFNEISKTVNFTSSTKLTQSGTPLSRLSGYGGRYLAAEAAPWVFDRKYSRWHNYKLDARPFRHLFFDNHSLYSMSSRIDAKNNQIFTVFRYDVGTAEAKPVGNSLISPPGQHLTMAEGHGYPYVYFYRVEQFPTTKRISFYRLDLRTFLFLSPLSEYTRDITGPVKKAHIFSGMGAFAVEVDHPTQNLLWDHKGCRYFNSEGTPLVLNYNQPVVATWSDFKGLSLIYLDKEAQAHISPAPIYGHSMRGLLQEDVWLANDGKRLFLAPRFDWGPRWLLKMTLGDNF